MEYNENESFEVLTADQLSIVEAYFPEKSQLMHIEMDDSGETTSEARTRLLKHDSKMLDKRALLIEFLLYPERFEPTDFAMEVVYRHCVPGAKSKTVWDSSENDFSDINPERIRSIYVTMSAGNPPSIDVHAEVCDGVHKNWTPVCSRNLSTDVTSWIQKKGPQASSSMHSAEVLQRKKDTLGALDRMPGMRDIIKPPDL